MIHKTIGYSFFYLLVLALLLSTNIRAEQTGTVTRASTAEAYRLRVENTQFGRIEVSTDAGRHYLLMGRVLRPATTTIVDKRATVPGIVVQSAPAGITLSVALGRIVRLRSVDATFGTAVRGPGKPPVRTAESMSASIVTNLAQGAGILGELAPQSGNVVSLQTEHVSLADLPGDYVPGINDVLVVVVPTASTASHNSLPEGPGTRTKAATQSVPERLEALARAYEAGAVTRAEAERRTVASGFFKLSAKLPVGEPVPIAFVTYVIDGDMVAAENVAPFTYAWDTRRTADGEHVVEVRALDGNGNLITSTRALVAVHNDTANVRN